MSSLQEVSDILKRSSRMLLTTSVGGLAGCVIAGRLAEADKKLKILVIEQGPNNYGMPEVVYPALYPRNLFPNSKITLFWRGNKAKELAGRGPIVPSGGKHSEGQLRECLFLHTRPYRWGDRLGAVNVRSLL